MPTQETKQYELTFILGEEATEKEAEAKVAQLKEEISKLEGSVTRQELWGRRELAYRIKRNRSGFYATLWLDLPAKQVPALESLLRFDEGIVRSLVTLAYTTAQPGSLYPVAEESKEEKGKREEDESTTAEVELRRSSGARPPKKAEQSEEAEVVSEEERLEKLDKALDDILKEEE